MSCKECGSFDVRDDNFFCVKCSDKYSNIGKQVEAKLKEQKERGEKR